jgi:hypothetical protein
MRHPMDKIVAVLAASLLSAGLLTGCGTAQAENADAEELFPKDYHPLIPELPRDQTQVGAGAVTGEALPQPVAFPHDRHVQKDGLSCEYCHNAARNSIHGGVPELQTCMGCHRYVLKTSPEIKLLTAYWERGEVMPWTRVHDLPDFVYFSHMRHVRAGVQCTECHGQVQTMTGTRVPPKAGHEAEAGAHGEAPAEAHPIDPKTAEEAVAALGIVEGTMTREATLQMGWCIDCHATHPSVDTNYGEKATLRRAELKDCWTCHK